MKEKNKIIFEGSISSMGKNKIIWVPLALHHMVKDIEGKKVKVTVEEV